MAVAGGLAQGGFVGLYQGSSGAADASAALKPLLPNISTYTQGTSSMPGLQNQVSAPASTAPSGGNLAHFESFLGGLGTQVGHLVGGATDWLAHNAVNLAESPFKLIGGIDSGIQDRFSLNSLQQQNNQISSRLGTLHTQFKAGTISSAQYQDGLKSITKDSTNLVTQAGALNNKIGFDQKASTLALVNTASALITVMTAGLGGLGDAVAAKLAESGITLNPIATKSATDWLASKVAEPILAPVVDTISRVASQPEVFKTLDVATQQALQRSTAEVVAQGASLTAPQIARATAVNIALKYPIYFNYMSSTANTVYQELDQGKYGDAIRAVAFNAALILSGGPIGQAFKYGGKAIAGTGKLTFGEGSFWDQLSQLYGDKSANGFSKAISDHAATLKGSAQADFLKSMSNVEATNMAAIGGNDVKAAAVQAASRLAKGMQGQYSTDLSSITHEQAVQDMVKFSKWQESFDTFAKANGLPLTTVGRSDVRDLSSIAGSVGEQPREQWSQAWADWKASNPNLAAANNSSFDTQMAHIMATNTDAEGLKQGIMDIKARQTAEGFPQKMIDAAAKEGYIPIQPPKIAAPFQEGSGVLKSAFGDSEFFTRTVQPLPVLSSVGQLLTGLGLSPEASSERVYQMFTDNVARNLSSTNAAHDIEKVLAEKQATAYAAAAEKAAAKTAAGGLTKEELALAKKSGITPEVLAKGKITGKAAAEEVATIPPKAQLSSSDLIMKKLSSFAKGLKVPVPDVRMLTNAHIQKALGVGFSDAADVQKAISKAYVDVPLAVRGLGDSAVDWTYNLPGSSTIMRRYLRVQGALRFSFNPFFQYLRVIPKTEILTSAEGGGFINSIFQGRAGQIGDIRTALRSGGFLNEKATLTSGVLGGEAVDSAGFAAKNISKTLLPMQERSIAGLIDSQAQRMGMDAQAYMTQYPEQVRDTVQMIAQYDKHSGFLNSPLARTLNVAIFPFRFDAKVVSILGRSMARQPLLTQVAFVNGMMKAHSWLTSPEGQAWYSQNSSAIAVLGYISPVLSLTDAFMSLVPGHDHSLGNFGQLGGLPFGWIPQVMDSVGLTHFNQSGVDPKTGDAIPKYIPATTKGQAAIAIQDFLGALFSYPGAELGLPSKASFTRNTALGIVGGSKTKDLTLQPGSLSPSEQQYQKNVQQANGTTPQSNTPNYQGAPTGTFSSPTPNANEDDLMSQLKAHATKPKAKTKAQFTPALAPGQTAFGQV